VRRWEANHLWILISNVDENVESHPLISNVGGKVESQPLISNVGGKVESQLQKREKKRKGISPRLLRKNRGGMSHLLLRLFHRTHILILFIALEFITSAYL